MEVDLRHCGPTANKSEEIAFRRLRAGLDSLSGDEKWILLTNLTLSVTHQRQSDEIDIVAIGPCGVRVIEVKHWKNRHLRYAPGAADLLNMKARRVSGKLAKVLRKRVYVDSAVLVTQPPSVSSRLVGQGKIRGVPFYSLSDGWQDAIGLNRKRSLTAEQVEAIAKKLQPRRLMGSDGSLREFAGYVDLEIQTPLWSTFHRSYKAVHPVRKDRVVLHLYDFSSSEDKNLETTARREYDALHRLQLYPWAPRIYDSFQDAPNYPAEIGFFSVVDPAAPTIAERAKDATWDLTSRLRFARAAVRAIAELHQAGEENEPMLHRNISPMTISVMHDNTPVFTGFEHTRIPSEMTLAIDPVAEGQWPHVIPPEIRAGTINAAIAQSDIYSLCASLQVLFVDDNGDRRSKQARNLLASGTASESHERVELKELSRELAELIGQESSPDAAPQVRYWTEGQVVRFRDRDYRIMALLGAGGIGMAFKVVEISSDTGEEVGTFVGKVARDATNGNSAIRSYQLAREPVSKHLGLASVFEVATQWQDNEFVALSGWVEGSALGDFAGLIQLLAEEKEEDPQELAGRWLRAMCEALGTMHRSGLVHGDVSPRNMILSGEDLVLTDYDCVTRIGDRKRSMGAALYASPLSDENGTVSAADDIHALAASFFHLLYDKEPFARDGGRLRKGVLNWDQSDRDEFPDLVEFFEKAVHLDSTKRLSTVADALATLTKSAEPDPGVNTKTTIGKSIDEPPNESPAERSPNEIPWLKQLLTAYPGSRWGNRETRGLDSDFAKETYVETDLERSLFDIIADRSARLIILCGNAGDGKTAMLQRLAEIMDFPPSNSSRRIIRQVMDDGLSVQMNLDGSAALKERSANDVLDEFLEPFREGPPSEDLVHLLAINDGRLLEWIRRPPHTPLKSSLLEQLEARSHEGSGDSAERESHIKFYHLNESSHVGSVIVDKGRIATRFLDELIDNLYRKELALKTWEPCLSCSAQEACQVFRAMKVFGPGDLPSAEPKPIRDRARDRLKHALQAVHFQGESHITVRELRSALVYILFGTRDCSEYHDPAAENERPYWDRAFESESAQRQGEVLRELVHLDPALEAHPKIDSQLLREFGVQSNGYPEQLLRSERRRAYFEWSKERIADVAGEGDASNALNLATGRYLGRFRKIPLMNDEERVELCVDLCRGIASLGDLPPVAGERADIVPLRIAPRTPTETAFWTEKPVSRFQLVTEADLGTPEEGASPVRATKERLPRKVYLIYTYQDGRKEQLRLSANLFHRLLRLAEGFQLGDVSTDDTFANLSIFLRRMVQEDDQELMAWNPMSDEITYRVTAESGKGPGPSRRRLVIRKSRQDGGSP